jgi:predicted CoA-binding protein
MPTTLSEIREFLAQKRIAFVGLSRNAKDLSRTLFRDMEQRGYDIVPVNPAIEEMEGKKCFARLQDVTPPVDAALLMISSKMTDQVVRDCAEAGIWRVWMFRGGGQGAASQQAVAFCKANGMRLVEGHCLFMFLPAEPWIHRAHGFLMKLTGKYPAATR